MATTSSTPVSPLRQRMQQHESGANAECKIAPRYRHSGHNEKIGVS